MRILICKFSLFSLTALSQSTDSIRNYHEACGDIGVFSTRLISSGAVGLFWDVKYYQTKRYSTGVTASFLARTEIDESFQYKIGQPVVQFLEIGWINQYDLLRKDKIKVDINLNNAFSYFELADNDLKDSTYSLFYLNGRPKEIATNYFYTLEPGIDFAYKILGRAPIIDLYLIAKLKYRFVFGDYKYGKQSDFTDYYFAFGFSFISSEKKRIRHKKPDSEN